MLTDGKKMSKRLKNYPDPEIVVDTHGADALRMVRALSVISCVLQESQFRRVRLLFVITSSQPFLCHFVRLVLDVFLNLQAHSLSEL